MIKFLFAVPIFLATVSAAAPASKTAAPQVAPSTATVSASLALGVSTYTVATLYTGDHFRDPFLPQSMGVPSRARDKNAPFVLDIHELELRGIMKDGKSDFAIFSTGSGLTLILRGDHLYDDHNKRLPGVSGRIMLKQKRAQLITADKDVQIYSLGDGKASDAKQQDEP